MKKEKEHKTEKTVWNNEKCSAACLLQYNTGFESVVKGLCIGKWV